MICGEPSIAPPVLWVQRVAPERASSAYSVPPHEPMYGVASWVRQQTGYFNTTADDSVAGGTGCATTRWPVRIDSATARPLPVTCECSAPGFVDSSTMITSWPFTSIAGEDAASVPTPVSH